MHLPYRSHSLTKQESIKIINGFLSKTQSYLSLSDAEMADMLYLKSSKSYSNLICKNKSLSLIGLTEFLDRVNISIDAICSGQVDYEVLVRQFHGDESALSKCYDKNAFSKMRSITNIIDYVEEEIGDRLKQRLLTRFQLKESQLKNKDSLINHKLLCDLLDYLHSLGFVEKDFFKMGLHSYTSNKNSEMAQELQKEKTPQKAYEKMMDEMANKYFDKNFSYRLSKLNKSECTFIIEQDEDVANLLERKSLGSPLLDITKAGVVSSFSMYLGLEQSLLIPKKSRYLGHKYWEYDIKFPNEIRRQASQSDNLLILQ